MRFALVLMMSSSWALAAPPGVTPPTPAPAPVPSGPMFTKLDADAVPESCRDLAGLADSPSAARAMSARISLASCLLDHELKPLLLCDCEQSVLEVEAASDLSLLLLDEVIAAGDPTTRILALHAKGEMLASLATRMLATVPPPVNATDAAAALRETRLQMLRPLVDPWLVQAQAAFRSLDKIARSNPQLDKNPAVVHAVRSARARIGEGVAKR